MQTKDMSNEQLVAFAGDYKLKRKQAKTDDYHFENDNFDEQTFKYRVWLLKKECETRDIDWNKIEANACERGFRQFGDIIMMTSLDNEFT